VRGWARRWIVGELSVRRVVTGAAFVYGSVCALALVLGDRLLFRPHEAGYADARGIEKLPSTHGARISARLFERRNAASGGLTVLYSHGNAEDLGDVESLVGPLRDLGLDVFAYDYQGYGTSEGEPSEKRVYDDVDAAYRHLVEKRGVAPARIVVYGRSLGSGPSVKLASERPVAALVLEAAFTSAFRVATKVRVLPWDRFENIERISAVRCPVFVVHGERDDLVPISMGRALFAAAPAPKAALWLENASHGDIPLREPEVYASKLAAFLASLPR
jgi:abhydrolase domain-containing protein 17